MDEGDKRFFRPAADVASAYGAAALQLDRATQFGLWLNLQRTAFRQSLPTTIGVGAAFGGADEAYFRNFMSEDEAKLQAAKVALMKQHAAAQGKA